MHTRGALQKLALKKTIVLIPIVSPAVSISTISRRYSSENLLNQMKTEKRKILFKVLISLVLVKTNVVWLKRVLVEVAGVEPASCGVFMQASTSLVGSYMFSPEVLASDLLTPEHRLRFH